MCTISWQIREQSFDVFFNRDEQRTRPLAVAPAIETFAETQAILPRDPQGGGTWLAASDQGAVFALLNFYQGRFPKGRLQSRGRIIPALIGFNRLDQVKTHLEQLVLDRYPPFSLLCFLPEQLTADDGVPMLRWDGKQLLAKSQHSPLFSSAIRYQDVFAQRENVYRDMIASKTDGPDIDDFLALHCSHVPAPSDVSICMHRDDAATVSLSHIAVNERQVEYSYWQGNPCQAPPPRIVKLNRPGRTLD